MPDRTARVAGYVGFTVHEHAIGDDRQLGPHLDPFHPGRNRSVIVGITRRLGALPEATFSAIGCNATRRVARHRPGSARSVWAASAHQQSIRCPRDCPWEAPKQRFQSQCQPAQSICEVDESEGFTRKIEDV